MEKQYQPEKYESQIYAFWEKGGYFTPQPTPKKKPFTIILPLPNANNPLHIGHALFVVQDILIRYQRMQGKAALWLPGADHAGIETQFVFEKELQKKGKSRFDFDRQTLYQMIFAFVEKNRHLNKEQMKKLGFSLDWHRYHYSLEPKIITQVLKTFKKLHQDGLIYRGEKLVNYCPACGTAFSNLEIEHVEKKESLYFLNYGPLNIATTRPETIFADAAVAVHPEDKRYQKLVDQKATIPLSNQKIPIIQSRLIDPKFGTGALKVTPAHDETDYVIGQENHLPSISVIDRQGKMINLPSKYQGMTVKEARQKVLDDLQKSNQLIKTKPLLHTLSVCYRCGQTIEPLLMPQWFVKIKPLAKPAISAIKKDFTKIVPKKRFEKMYLDWLENIHDWNISRQIVWGPPIPAWYCLDCHPDIFLEFIDPQGKKRSGPWSQVKNQYPFADVKKGLQTLTAAKTAAYTLKKQACPKCGGDHVLQETDTFDTWFLSGQWPLTTLGYPDSPDFQYFYPTDVLDTMWDILFFWVARMMIFGLYLTQKVPFRTIHLHCRVVDEKGQKMSKSKGNVIDPIKMVKKYGADALRLSLIFGAAPGSDICLGEDKLKAMRNFTNKIWNASRFILADLNQDKKTNASLSLTRQTAKKLHPDDRFILAELKKTVCQVTAFLDKFRFDLALETIYHFFWHVFCDQYLEKSKKRRIEAQATLQKVLADSLKLLHPFAPFVTEAVWQKMFSQNQKPLLVTPWPKK